MPSMPMCVLIRRIALGLLILPVMTACDPNYPFQIDSVTPNKGPTVGGTIVTIYSRNLTKTTAVLFGGVQSPDVKVINDIVVQAMTPPNSAGSVDVALYDTESLKNQILPAAFTYEDPPAPSPTPLTVTSVLPAIGPSSGGTNVTLLGTGFEAGVAIVFGDAGATDITVVNNQVVSLTTPAHSAGPVDISVIAPDGQSTVVSGGFVYGDPPPPLPLTIASVQPGQGNASGGTSVTLLGTQFQPGMAVLFGNVAATDVQVINSQIATAKTPANAPGMVDVSIIDNQSTATRTVAYEYLDDGPQIVSVTPNIGPDTGGTQVTINGSGFCENAAVLFGALAATNVDVINSQLLTAISPPQAAGTVDISVNCNGVTRVAAAAFQYEAAPPLDVMITSVDPASGPVEGGTDVTIRGTGFISGTAVLFGNLAATEVVVINDQIIRAVSPAAEAPGFVRIALLFAGMEVERPNAFEYTGVLVDNITDSDGDGISDWREATGWEVWVDFFGFGFGQDTFGNITRYMVTSDPQNDDADMDGLGDRLEFLNRSDPRNPDTDGDGLLDGEEYNQWFTSPISVDTDGDSRGPAGDLAPSAVLFDGMELYRDDALLALPPGHAARKVSSRGLSPTLADTDGDGRTDYDEYDVPTRTPYLADLPRVEFELVGDVDVRLNVEYAETQGQATEYGKSFSKSESTTIGTELSTSVEISYSNTVEESAVVEPPGLVGGSVTASSTFGASFGLTASFRAESTEETTEELSELRTNSRDYTETVSTGFIRTAIRVRNPGNITFGLSNVNLLVKQVEKYLDEGNISQQRSFRTVATLVPVTNALTLAPGEAAGPFELSANDINSDAIRELLTRPDSLSLEPVSFEMQNDEGISFDFIREITMSQTALITIDLGGGDLRRYYIATNVDRNPNGTLKGISMRQVLEDVLGLPFGDAVNGFTTINRVDINGQPLAGPKVLGSLAGFNKIHRPQGGPTGGFDYWTVTSNHPERHSTVDFDKIQLFAGDEITLVYQRDDDNDGLVNNVEIAAGTDQNPDFPNDADSDGLTDRFEVISGWIVFEDPANPVDPNNPGVPPPPPGAQYYRAFSDPRVKDSDGDGLQDAQEYAKRTDPNDPDTDGDGLTDDVDPYPILKARTAYVRANIGASGSGLSWASAKKTLQEALTLAASTNSNAIPTDDISQIWVAAGIYRPHTSDRDASFNLRNNVALYGGFSGPGTGFNGESKLGERNPRPYTNGTILSGDLFGNDTGDVIDLTVPASFQENSRTVIFADTVNKSARLDGFMITGAYNDESDSRTENGSDHCSSAEVIAGTGYFIYQNGSAEFNPDPNVPLACNDIYHDLWFKWTAERTTDAIISTVNLSIVNTAIEVYVGPDCANLSLVACGSANYGGSEQSYTIFPVIAGMQYYIRLGGEFSGSGPAAAFDQRFSIHYYKMGGGMHCNGSPTLANLLFIRNVSTIAGGGLYVTGGSPTLTNCTFAENLAQVGAGAFLRTNGRDGGFQQGVSAINMKNCSFEQNEARFRPGSQIEAPNGGGLAIYGRGRVDLDRCTFAGNQAYNWGGGVFISDLEAGGFLRVANTRFATNSISRPNDGGAYRGAGGGMALFGNASVVNSTFWNNSAKSHGGGIAAFRRLDIFNSTLSYNRTFFAGGGNQGGGINSGRADFGNNAYVRGGIPGYAIIENCILWNNWFGSAPIPDDATFTEAYQFSRRDNSTMVVRTSCFNSPNTVPGNNNFGDDPRLQNPLLGNFALAADSPCVDRGNNFVDTDPLVPGLQLLPDVDFTGNTRILDGNNDGAATVDVGAFEAPAATGP